ncbi:MAG: MlaE family lipid ABC transporter permease subunit [Alphaproteobacteria bacterium]|nr:MlaE family lipid ABC transporter permease subunit [Alphaproteobacteria bacterium]MBV9064065.1 MlaE family lipid ABC transporter permease subunit [Alphaproteobacteria bacterium]
MRNRPLAKPDESLADLRIEWRQNVLRLLPTGEWNVGQSSRLDQLLHGVRPENVREAEIDGRGITELDSAGAWLLLREKRELESSGVRVRGFVLPDRYGALLQKMEGEKVIALRHASRPRGFVPFLESLGRGTMHALGQGYGMLGFLGRVTVEATEALLAPRRELPLPAFVRQIEETGLTALPIVGLLAFLVGVVLAYQGADQLHRFGAEIFTVDLLGVGFLRELGGLITAIIVAGRSGSAFTAHIGTMRVNEEIDAMETMGLNIAEVLVLPRVLGLVIALPLLTFYADMVGLIGGLVMCYFDLHITVPVFMRELQQAITYKTLLVGLIKAPVFAFLIGLVGCFEGLRVERNAESVGRLTTRSVVESIFLIITFDAAFSILFSIIGI